MNIHRVKWYNLIVYKMNMTSNQSEKLKIIEKRKI